MECSNIWKLDGDCSGAVLYYKVRDPKGAIHDEGMEVTKNFQKGCPGVIVTINPATADYTVMLDRESKQNRGLLRTNS